MSIRKRIEKLEEQRRKGQVIAAGDVVALGMVNGDCPVGCVEAMDRDFLRLWLFSFLDGTFGHRVIAVRRSDVERMEFARQITKEEATESGDFIMWGNETARTRYFDTKRLGAFQSEWKRCHEAGEPKP